MKRRAKRAKMSAKQPEKPLPGMEKKFEYKRKNLLADATKNHESDDIALLTGHSGHRQRLPLNAGNNRIYPGSNPADKISGFKAGRKICSNDPLGSNIRQRSFQPVAHFNPHSPIIFGNEEEDAIIHLVPPLVSTAPPTHGDCFISSGWVVGTIRTAI